MLQKNTQSTTTGKEKIVSENAMNENKAVL